MKKRTKKILTGIIYAVSLLLIIGCTLLVVYYNKCKTTLSIEATQVEQTQNILVGWDTSQTPDSVTIEVTHNGDKVIKTTISNAQTAVGKYKIEAFYGKQKIKVTIKKGIYKTSKTTEVALSADEYVIAPITATMPVTLFTLSLDDITNGYTTPTFVWFKRIGVWDYSQMKDNMYMIPVLDSNDLVHDKYEGDVYKKVSTWVKELYEINPNSKFNFYYNDYYVYGWMEATIANDIPKENYHVTLLSDGPSSFRYFNDRFANAEDYDSTYAEMKNEYNEIKEGLKENNNYIRKNKSLINSALREYVYVMLQEETNVEWWLTRISGTMSTNNEEVYAKLEALVEEGKIHVKDLKTLLMSLDESGQEYVKKLYKFNSTMFEEAEKQNKEVMVILGTWHESEDDFETYVSIMQKLYGDEYVLYYKGHPKSPTLLIEGKMDKLNSLGLVDIDSTIPAELIFFFNPDAFASGYTTSTFYSITAEKSVGLFNIRKADLLEDYGPNMDLFISRVNAADEQYGSLVSNDSSFVIEFTQEETYDIAIYDSKNQTFKYYKNNGTSYVVVEK